ncbi:MAG: hypothetical protein R3281_11625 [Balneolaceae bacterium]|nr:hypothetical protein [Balneolaceae bacterium]
MSLITFLYHIALHTRNRPIFSRNWWNPVPDAVEKGLIFHTRDILERPFQAEN